MAVSEDTALIGAPRADGFIGAAYIFVRSGTVWTLQNKFRGTDTVLGDLFGAAVAISGDLAVVGARYDSLPSNNDASGSAYVFQLGCLHPCCLPDGSCDMTTDAACTGIWHPELSDCSEVTCPAPLAGDLDFDGDVDIADFALLQAGFTGPS